jgi:hypothetical protein
MGTYIRPDKAIRENIIVKMEEDRDAVQAAFGDLFEHDHIEHDVDFADVAVAGPPQTKSRVALADLVPSGGAAVANGLGGIAATLDIQIGAVSLLSAPAALAAAGVPVALDFLPNTLVPAGSKIDFIFDDGVSTAEGISCNVQWVKDLNNPWVP